MLRRSSQPGSKGLLLPVSLNLSLPGLRCRRLRRQSGGSRAFAKTRALHSPDQHTLLPPRCVGPQGAFVTQADPFIIIKSPLGRSQNAKQWTRQRRRKVGCQIDGENNNFDFAHGVDCVAKLAVRDAGSITPPLPKKCCQDPLYGGAPTALIESPTQALLNTAREVGQVSVLERQEPGDDVMTPSFYKGVNRRPSFRNPFFRVCSSGTPFIQTDRRRAPSSLAVGHGRDTEKRFQEREKFVKKFADLRAAAAQNRTAAGTREKKQMLQLASTFSSVFSRSLSPFLSLFKRNSFW